MAERPRRVLVSCREPGGLGHVRAVVRALRADDRWEVVLAASGTALRLLRAAGERPLPLAHGPDADPGQLLAEAARLLASVAPDAVLASHSSDGVGVDEALVASARVPTFVVQDFWGEVNLGLGVPASAYLVYDEHAAARTAERWGIEDVVVIGSPKHEVYAELDIPGLRARTRAALGVGPERPLIGFFGQSPDLPGYAAVVDGLLEAVAAGRPPAVLVVREHPTFGAAAAVLHARLAARHDLDLRVLPTDLAAEAALAACDVACTLFSLSGLDHAHLSGHSPRPLGAAVYLMTDPALRAYAEAHMGMVHLPIVDRGIGTCVIDPAGVASALQEALAGAEAYHRAARGLVVPGAARRAVDAIAARLDG